MRLYVTLLLLITTCVVCVLTASDKASIDQLQVPSLKSAAHYLGKSRVKLYASVGTGLAMSTMLLLRKQRRDNPDNEGSTRPTTPDTDSFDYMRDKEPFSGSED